MIKYLTRLEIALVLALLFVGSVCVQQDATIQKQKALIRLLSQDLGHCLAEERLHSRQH